MEALCPELLASARCSTVGGFQQPQLASASTPATSCIASARLGRQRASGAFTHKASLGTSFRGRTVGNGRTKNSLKTAAVPGLECVAVLSEVVPDINQLVALTDHFHMMLGVGVGLPCTVMECGDVIHRSTLSSQGSFRLTAGGVALFLGIVSYLWATPGVAPGFWDMFVLAPVEAQRSKKLTKEDFVLGKKLGEGAYGTVWRATWKNPLPGKAEELVVKKANEFGAVEIWMNERVRRACPNSCANFVSGFLEKSLRFKDEFWLVWKFEGNTTLYEILNNKDFPYNVEESLFGSELDLPRGPERENLIILNIMKQLLTALDRLHRTGIVHRDIKPQNIIFSDETGLFKIIDLGAAADLRVGINYQPKEFLLDPRYAAPEQYIMSTQTPSAPPPPVATALSPVLWQMNLPDRFDIYSAGLIFLQMAFPTLRPDGGIITFNRQLKRCDYDIKAWRDLVTKRPSADMQKGFAIMDLDDGLGWELVQAMVRFKGRQRISASAALAHPYFTGGNEVLQRFQLVLSKFQAVEVPESLVWVSSLLAKSGTRDGGFTEAQLYELGIKERKASKATLERNALAAVLRLQRKAVRTIDVMSMDNAQQDAKNRNWWNRWQSRSG